MGNPRYKELKYNGKTYTQKYQIDEILLEKKLNWVLDAEMENARLEIMKDTLIFNGGIIFNAIWEYGVIRNGEIRNIVFLNGVIYDGVFKKIKMEKGIIFGGTFYKGSILFADVRGGEFKDVDISTNVNVTQKEELENEPQPTIQQTQPTTQSVKVEGEIKNQEGGEIQAQVQENKKYKYIKTYNNFK